MDFIGTSGRDNFVGTVDPDSFDMSQGGRDTVSAGDGDDTLLFGTELNDNDVVDGGAGFDVMVLEGNYFGGLTFLATTMVGVEEIDCLAGFTYSLTLNDATASDAFFYVDAHTLGAGDALVLDATAETASIVDVEGGAGDDSLTVSYRGTFRLQQGGADSCTGGSGIDSFFLYDTFDPSDVIAGNGADLDRINLAGDYSAGLTITAAMLSGVEIADVASYYSGDFTVEDGVIAAGETLRWTMNSFGTPPGQTVTVDGSAESDGFWNFTGGVADDNFTGGALADEFDYADLGSGGQDGDDASYGGDGDDTIRFGTSFGRSDTVDGGAGFDVMTLTGDYSAGVNFSSTTMRDVEILGFTGGFSYALTVGNNNVAATGFTVLADALTAADTLDYDGSAETVSGVILYGGDGADTVLTGGGDDTMFGGDGADSLTGGAGDDTISGERGQDVITGGAGTDRLRGGLAANTFVFTGVAESTGAGRDWVDVLKPMKDQFDLDVGVSGVDARVNAGTLSEASFDGDLAAAIGAGQLAADHAVVFKPNAGGLSGHFFLIVDANGSDGYQAGDDYVMEFAAGSHPNLLAAGFFV